MPDTLTTRLRERLEEAKRLAEAATPGPWTTPGPDTIGEWMIYGKTWAVASATVSDYHGDFLTLRTGPNGEQANRNAAFIASRDPADALREVEHGLGVLERHAAEEYSDGLGCTPCASIWPCAEVRALATRWGVAEDSDG